MTEQDEWDANLLVVAAVEGYSRRYHQPARLTVETFDRRGVLGLIRQHYGALHTQALDETVDFAEDVLARSGA